VILLVLKEQLHLSSPMWPLIVLVAGAIWFWRRPVSRGVQWYLAAAAVVYWVMTTPLGANLLVGGLSRGMSRISAPEQAKAADVVVVLGGGATTAVVGSEVGGALTLTSLLRALEAARVFKLIGAKTLIVSGGIPRPDKQVEPESALMRDIVVKAGVPPSAIVEESRSTNTHDQALLIGPILRRHRSRTFVLVTSPMHMRRSLAVFKAEGFDPIGSMAPLRSEQVRPPGWLLPNDDSFSLSDQAVYDYVALAYYWSRGWIHIRNPQSAMLRVCDALETGTAGGNESAAGAVGRGAHPERIQAAASQVKPEPHRLPAQHRQVRTAPDDRRPRAVLPHRHTRF
jgi:uncharacterized SAM-binding protein YcdF (DUF218 family)